MNQFDTFCKNWDKRDICLNISSDVIRFMNYFQMVHFLECNLEFKRETSFKVIIMIQRYQLINVTLAIWSILTGRSLTNSTSLNKQINLSVVVKVKPDDIVQIFVPFFLEQTRLFEKKLVKTLDNVIWCHFNHNWRKASHSIFIHFI